MADLKTFSNDELIFRMEKLVHTERKITHLILVYIVEIEERKIYSEMGYDGMYAYLTRGLGYSEGAAYRRLHSARLLKKVPTVAKKIEDGRLNLTQLTQVQKCIKESIRNGEEISTDKTLEVLNKLENKNSFETQKTLSFEMNLPIETCEKITPQKDESVRIELTLTKEQFAELEQAKSLLSHVCPDGSWSDIISTLAKNLNRKKLEGRSKSTRSATAMKLDVEMSKFEYKPDIENQTLDKDEVGVDAGTKIISQTNVTSLRGNISIRHKRILLKKAQHCCEYQDPKTGRRCGSKYQLEVDHCHPIALGGGNELSNLRILCRAHNALAARQAGLEIFK